MSIFSRDESEHTFPHPQVKLEGPADLTDDESFSPDLRQIMPMTVTPDRLGIFPYDSAYGSPPLAKYEMPESYEDQAYDPMSYRTNSRSPREGVTPRTRIRRNTTTKEKGPYLCHQCGRDFHRAYNHKTHLETHNPSRKKEHVCPYKDCDKQFVRKTDLDRHQNSVHRKLKIFGCQKCDSQFARKDTLRRSVHGSLGLPELC